MDRNEAPTALVDPSPPVSDVLMDHAQWMGEV
jgi:hypothetical protein